MLLAALVVALPAQGGGGGRRRPIASGNTTPKFLPTGSLQIPESLAGGALALRAASGAIAADAAGRVFVGACASDFSHRIVVFDSKGKYVRDFRVGNCGVGEGVRIAAGPDGNIYATRAGPNNQIGVYTPDGAQVRLIGGVGRLETATARDIDIDSHGNIYVTIRHDTSDGGPDNDEIVRLSASGAVTARWQPLPLCNGHGCARLQGVAPADDGTLWVTTDVAKLGIQHVDANGKLLPDAPRLDVILREIGNHVRDIDYAAGKLYLVGDVKAFVVLSPKGQLLDQLCCEHVTGDIGDRQVAVAGTDVYVPGIVLGSSSTHVLRADALPRSVVGHEQEYGIRTPSPYDSDMGSYSDTCNESAHYQVPVIRLSEPGCKTEIYFGNRVDPCKAAGYPSTKRILPGSVFVGGKPVIPAAFAVGHEALTIAPPPAFAALRIPARELSVGSVVVSFTCELADGSQVQIWEWKGELVKSDPSGTVVDRTTGRPIEGAHVQLLFSPTNSGPFAVPGLSGISPQVNTEVTARDGGFAWDVADGYWRMKVTAFGYRPFTSRVYTVPPPVTGLRFALQENPAQQRVLIDPTGSVAGLRLGTKTKRVAGLRTVARRGRVRSIVVLAKRFRTAKGISLGSSENAFTFAYPGPAGAAARASKGRPPTKFRVARTTFSVRGGRVVGITVG